MSFELKELQPKHKQVAALLAQGVGRQVIAEVCEITPEYVTMLAAQPIVRAYLKHLEAYADTQLMALAGKRTEVISDVLDNGNNDDRLKAAKLQMEATGKIGTRRNLGDDDVPADRLEHLSKRLIQLLNHQRGRTYNGEAETIEVESESQSTFNFQEPEPNGSKSHETTI